MEEYLQNFPAPEIEEEEAEGGLFVLFSILRRFWFLIVIFTIVGTAIGVGMAFMRDKTVYTQSKKVVCIVEIKDKNLLTNASLTNRYIPTIKEQLTTPLFINKANEVYRGEDFNGDGWIYAGAIGVATGKTLIFRVSYSDESPEIAEAKLNAFLQAAQQMYEDNDSLTTGDKVKFKAIDDIAITSESNSFALYIVIGFFGGLVLGALLVFLLFLLDSTISSKDELERITGANVIAFIDTVKE